MTTSERGRKAHHRAGGNHYDHLDEASIRALSRQAGGPPLFVVPLGLKGWLADRGVHVAVELDWWDLHRVGGVDVTLVPAQHWSARGHGVPRAERGPGRHVDGGTHS